MKKLLLLSITLICVSCIGESNTTSNPTISVTTSGACSSITTNTCQVTLTYNTAGASGLSLSSTASPQAYSQFNIQTGLATCQVQSVTTNQQCIFTIGYTPGASVSENIYFSLGSANSNSITVSN